MKKTILITGATDGIGLETAKLLVADGHTVLIHGRSKSKLAAAENTLNQIEGKGSIKAYLADFSKLSDVDALASAIASDFSSLDVLINNAGVFGTPEPITPNGFDVRFIVNTLAPYRLSRLLFPLLPPNGRVVNLSSAAQAPVDLSALEGQTMLSDTQAYAQSKLALTMWSFHLAGTLAQKEQVVVAVNPASFLASKMVKDAYGVAGNDLSIGANIIVRAALSEEFKDANGRYFDNDLGRFSSPHIDALDTSKNEQLVKTIENLLASIIEPD